MAKRRIGVVAVAVVLMSWSVAWAQTPRFEAFDGIGPGGEAVDVASGSRTIDVYGVNWTGQEICDFTIHLRGCAATAKIHRIKMVPRVDLRPDGTVKREHGQYDWDVDDNLDGRASQDQPADPGAPGGTANESDNVDDSPGQDARVDSGGIVSPSCCATFAAPRFQQAARDAQARGTEDQGEHYPGQCIKTRAGREKFRITVDLTAPAAPAQAGGRCVAWFVPTTATGRVIERMPECLKLPENYCSLGPITPITGTTLVMANTTGHVLTGLQIEPVGFALASVRELDADTGQILGEAACVRGRGCTLALYEAIEPGGTVVVETTRTPDGAKDIVRRLRVRPIVAGAEPVK